MKQYPVIINVRDRITDLVALLQWLEKMGQENIWLCDNASTYPPLVEFLHSTSHHVLFNEINLGHRAPWLSGLVTELGLDSYFIVTDPDVVPCDDCPTDVFDFLQSSLETFQDVDKIGLSLRIDDIPQHYMHADEVVKWESQFWTKQIAPFLFAAPVDTTFAMYRPGEGHLNSKSLRSGPPYHARHMPWYQNSLHQTEEQQYYMEHADSFIINWDRKILPASLRAHLIQLRDQPTDSGRQ